MMSKFCKYYINVTKWKPSREEWLWITSSIPNDEVDRVNQFVYQEDSKSSLLGQALIRKFLAQETGIPSNVHQLTRNNHGRPEVVETYKETTPTWPNVLDFNVSHSGDFCVFAGLVGDADCPSMSVGVDVTKIVKKKTKPELDRFLELMSRREFTKSEWETVEKVTCDRQKCINFTRLWCLKESFIKSIGIGLSFRLRRISFYPDVSNRYNLDPTAITNKILDTTQVILDDKLAKDWKFLESALDENHLVAIGYHIEPNSSISADSFPFDRSPFVELSIEELMKGIVPFGDREKEENWLKFKAKRLKG